jgi:hypothetical protein
MSPLLRRYNLFISHAWSHDDDYHRLVKLLGAAPSFQWSNYSVPRHDPLIDPNSYYGFNRLKRELADQIRFTHCVLIASGMYAAHRRWIQVEISIAQAMEKPIVGVVPWGQQRTPVLVQLAAKEMVRWNTVPIISAIRRHAL